MRMINRLTTHAPHVPTHIPTIRPVTCLDVEHHRTQQFVSRGPLVGGQVPGCLSMLYRDHHERTGGRLIGPDGNARSRPSNYVQRIKIAEGTCLVGHRTMLPQD